MKMEPCKHVLYRVSEVSSDLICLQKVGKDNGKRIKFSLPANYPFPIIEELSPQGAFKTLEH